MQRNSKFHYADDDVLLYLTEPEVTSLKEMMFKY